MKKCLLKFPWVKVPREEIPALKGLLGYWLKLVSRAVFRKGASTYCGYENAVEPGMWVGGIVGLKSILDVRNREKALQIMEELQKLGYITYTLEPGTKILTYRITDWVLKCSGAECCDGVVYTTDGYGFLCMPRNITERLAEQGRVFDEADAWLDLWCHTVWQDYGGENRCLISENELGGTNDNHQTGQSCPHLDYASLFCGRVSSLFPVSAGVFSLLQRPDSEADPGAGIPHSGL